MAKATSGVTYINGVTQTLNDGKQEYVGNSTIALGGAKLTRKYSDGDDAARGVGYLVGTGSAIHAIETQKDVNIGGSDRKLPAGSVKDRAPNLPSGYAADGTPTYGSGKKNTVTTWATDYANGNASGSFQYAIPLGHVNKRFVDLT